MKFCLLCLISPSRSQYGHLIKEITFQLIDHLSLFITPKLVDLLLRIRFYLYLKLTVYDIYADVAIISEIEKQELIALIT